MDYNANGKNGANSDFEISGFEQFPGQWRFVAIAKGGKAPIGKAWQDSGKEWAEVAKPGSRYQGRPVGAVGLLCGPKSGGVLLIDCDGEGAKALLQEWASVSASRIPPTWFVTSGRPGRGQFVFWVPQEYWASIETRKYKASNGDMLELRWDGCQSLVYGQHPSGSTYQWMNTTEEIAVVPEWVIEKMLKESRGQEVGLNGSSNGGGWREFDRSFKLPIAATVPLEVCLSREDRALLESGSLNGSRNDSGFRLAVNLIATASYLDSIGQRYDGIPEQLFDQYCRLCAAGDGWGEREWDQVWLSAQKKGGGTTLTPEAIEGCIKAWHWKSRAVVQQHNTVTVPTHQSTHEQNTGVAQVPESRVLSVATSRERMQFALLQEMQRTSFDPALLLPTTMAMDIARDAQLLAIDPVAIWVYLMPAIATLMGKIKIDFSGWAVPNIIWSAIAQKSGRGKTRAMGLVTDPLWEKEKAAEDKFQAEMKRYKEACRQAAKDGDEEPPKPIREKHLFNIATPQAVIKRQSEQQGGVLWARDELKGGLAFDQFGNGKESEALEMILETWDGKCAQVDRVSTDDSFFVPGGRLSIAGGFQPKIAKKMMDPEDPQGFMARFLIAMPHDQPYKRVVGHPVLAQKLPALYDWVASVRWGDLTPTVEADDIFTEIAEYFNNAPAPNDALDFWQKKAAGNCLRVAGVLHALECYYSPEKNKKRITRDTLMKAYYYVSLCRRWVYALQGQMTETMAVSSLMQKILDKTDAMGGTATLADLYRNISPLRRLAKEEGRGVADFTEALCRDLQDLGLGEVSPNEKGTLEFRKTSTLNTLNPATYTPPILEVCVDTSEYQHTPHTQHTVEALEEGFHPQGAELTEPVTPPPLQPGERVTITEGEYSNCGVAVLDALVERDGETFYVVSARYGRNGEATEMDFTAELPISIVRRWNILDRKSPFSTRSDN